MNPEEIIKDLNFENKRVISRTITLVEEGNTESRNILNAIYSKTGNAYRIGITGPSGAGKSTITNQLTKYFRRQNRTVAILAVDPTSPFTGGALIGDRIRMNEIGNDNGVFIRSMATRGSFGGLSKRTIDAADIIDASGFDYILFETVGVGQSELNIARTTDTTIVVLVPESCDSIQAMKAGLMEIADIFIMNKSDRPGADAAIISVQMILNFKSHDEKSWIPKIIRSIATENKGIEELALSINTHRAFLENNNLLLCKREHNSKIRIKEIVESQIKNELWTKEREALLNDSIEKVVVGHLSPYLLSEELINNYKKNIF
jgi:LAO/AO transport system kinase